MLLLYKFRHFFMPLAAFFCISLFFSCSSDVEMPPPPLENPNPSSSAQVWSYCVYPQIQGCYSGSYSTCPGSGGELKNDCPYSSSVQSSSGGSNVGNSSSSEAGQGNSSSGTAPQEYGYCVFAAERNCLSGPLTICPPGGELSNDCPYGSSSSSVGTTTSSSSVGTTTSSPSLTNSFTDPRDGKKYKYEVAPDGKIWMSENLNYSKNGTVGWCYKTGTNAVALGTAGEEGEGCNGPYGRIYDWATAMGGDNPNPPQGLCPTGWHIPNTTEWSTIKTGTMSSDFYILSGNYDPTKGWKDKGSYGFYWTSSGNSYFTMFVGSTSDVQNQDKAATSDKFSVRCVADDSFRLNCGGVAYNPSTHFCSGTTPYPLCGNKSYEPATQRCGTGNIVETQCGNDYYNPATQFCYGNQKYAKCGGATYDPSVKFCSGTTIKDLCGGKEYNPSTQECVGTTLFSKCGAELYNPSEKFCSGSTIYPLCNGNDYNPAYAECISNAITPRTDDCNGVSYLLTEKFCYDGKLYNLCDGKSYYPPTHKCVDNELEVIGIVCNGGVYSSQCNKMDVTLNVGECVGISVLGYNNYWTSTLVMMCFPAGSGLTTFTLSFNGISQNSSTSNNAVVNIGKVVNGDNYFGSLCLTSIADTKGVNCNLSNN